MRSTLLILVTSALLLAASQAQAENPPSLILEWGGQGSGQGEFFRADVPSQLTLSSQNPPSFHPIGE